MFRYVSEGEVPGDILGLKYFFGVENFGWTLFGGASLALTSSRIFK